MLVLPLLPTLMARVLTGELSAMPPLYLRLGIGRYVNGVPVEPTPDNPNLEIPILSPIPCVLVRTGGTVQAVARVDPPSGTHSVTEAGLFLEDGTPLLVEAFPPIVLQAGLPLEWSYTLLAEG